MKTIMKTIMKTVIHTKLWKLTVHIYMYICVSLSLSLSLYIYIYIYGGSGWSPRCTRWSACSSSATGCNNYYGRFPKFHRVFLGRDPGTLKSNIVSKNIHNQFVRIWDSQIEKSKIKIMETDRTNDNNHSNDKWCSSGATGCNNVYH